MPILTGSISSNLSDTPMLNAHTTLGKGKSRNYIFYQMLLWCRKEKTYHRVMIRRLVTRLLSAVLCWEGDEIEGNRLIESIPEGVVYHFDKKNNHLEIKFEFKEVDFEVLREKVDFVLEQFGELEDS